MGDVFTMPNTPSEGMMKRIERLPIWQENAIIYTIRSVRDPITGLHHKAVKCTCTDCGATWYESYYSMHNGCSAAYNTAPAPYGIFDHTAGGFKGHGDMHICDGCGAVLTLLWAGSMRPYRVHREAIVTELRNVDGRACVISFLVRLIFGKDASKIHEILPWEAYELYGGRITRWTGHKRTLNSGETLFGRFERRIRYSDQLGGGPILYEPKGCFDGTEAENSRAEIIAKQDTWIVSYLHKWLKTPVLEAIAESGGAKLIAEAINKMTVPQGYYGKRQMSGGKLAMIVNQKEKRPAQALGLTKEEYRWCIEDRWPESMVRLYQKASAAGIRWARDDMRAIMMLGDRDTDKVFALWPEETIRIVRYMQKQIMKKTGPSHLLTITEYIDYREALIVNGEDTPENRYPRALVAAHDREVEKRRLIKDREKDIKIAARAEKLAALSWQKDGLIIRPARSTGELIKEGKMLNHCVGGYGNSVAEGNATILFIRREEETEVSFYTLQLDEKTLTVVQNHGKRNKLQTDEVKTFEREWIEHIKRDLVREKDGTWRERKETKRGDKNANRNAS